MEVAPPASPGGLARRAGLPRRIWDGLEEGLAALLLALMVLVTFVTVITRYVFDLPLSYIDQLVPNVFVWVTFLGAAAAVKRRAHLGLSLVADALPVRLRAALDVVVFLGTGAFFLGAGWYGARVVLLQIENRMTTSLGYPSWLVGLAVPVGSALFAIRLAEAWWRHRRRPGEGGAGVPAI